MKLRPSIQIFLSVLFITLSYIFINKDEYLSEAAQQTIAATFVAFYIIFEIALAVFVVIVSSELTDSANKHWNLTKAIRVDIGEYKRGVDIFILRTRWINPMYWLVFLIRYVDRNYKKE